jgi:hypothetical protein
VKKLTKLTTIRKKNKPRKENKRENEKTRELHDLINVSEGEKRNGN